MASTALADDAQKRAKAEGEKPTASPGWAIIEEDWWYPLRHDFLDSLHRARVHYREREEKAASAEIDKAVTWMKYAQIRAEKSTEEDLATARANLMDFSESLKSGRPVIASKLETAFAHASAALANHHYFKSTQAVAQGDLRTAGRHLMLAADHVRAAARSANHAYGSEIVTIYDDYAPYGYWDETIVFDKNTLEVNLTAVKAELEKLATKLKAVR